MRLKDFFTNRLLKNAYLRRSPHPSSLRRTSKYVSLLRRVYPELVEGGALHLGIFDQPVKEWLFGKLLIKEEGDVTLFFA